MNTLTTQQLKETFESSEVQESIREKNKQYILVEYFIVNEPYSGSSFSYDHYITFNYNFGPITPGIVVKVNDSTYELYDTRGLIGIFGIGAFHSGSLESYVIRARPRVLVKLENGEWIHTLISLDEFEELEW